MKKIMQGLFVTIFVVTLSGVSTAAEKIDINDAFKKGLISITVIGKAKGEMVELRIKKISDASIIVTIKKGRTDLGGEVSILSNIDKEIDLTSKYDSITIIAQTGPDRLTGGPITLDPSKSK
jgi:hypothetical protein